jgi:hypothetical protein
VSLHTSLGVIDVKAKGCKGDGVTNDTVKFQEALDAWVANGGELRIPKGTYMVSNLVLNAPNNTAEYLLGTIQGASKRGSIIKQIAGSVGPILSITGDTGTGNHLGKVVGLTMRDLQIQGTPGGGVGLFLQILSDVTLDNVSIRDAGSHGIEIARVNFAVNDDDYAYAIRMNQLAILLCDGDGIKFSETRSVACVLVDPKIQANDGYGMRGCMTNVVVLGGFIGQNGKAGCYIDEGTSPSLSYAPSFFATRFEANCVTSGTAEIVVEAAISPRWFNCFVITKGETVEAYSFGTTNTTQNPGVIGGLISVNSPAANAAWRGIRFSANCVRGESSGVRFVTVPAGASNHDNLGSNTLIQTADTDVTLHIFSAGLRTNSISEDTTDNGVVIDSVRCKDGLVRPAAAAPTMEREIGYAANELQYHDGTAVRNVEKTSRKGVASGYCDLDTGALVPVSRLPAAALAAIGAVLKAAAPTAPAASALTDNTGGTATTTVAQAAAITAAPVDTGAAKLEDVQALRATMHDNFADVVAQVNLNRARIEDIYSKLAAAGSIA